MYIIIIYIWLYILPSLKRGGASQVAQWLRLCSRYRGDLGLIPGRGTSFHVEQLKDPEQMNIKKVDAVSKGTDWLGALRTASPQGIPAKGTRPESSHKATWDRLISREKLQKNPRSRLFRNGDVSKDHTQRKNKGAIDDYHAKWSKSETSVSQTNLLTKQKQTLRLTDSQTQKTNHGYQRGKVGREKLKV